MSMLISQADELRTLAGGLRKLYENGANLTRVQVAGLTTAVESMREAADTIESLRDRLQELQGVTGESRYSELFGTPERAARTLARMCQGVNTCGTCPLFGADLNYCKNDYTDFASIAEWLRDDA